MSVIPIASSANMDGQTQKPGLGHFKARQIGRRA
jgi:hypothetical protein